MKLYDKEYLDTMQAVRFILTFHRKKLDEKE